MQNLISLPSKGEVVFSVENFPVHPFAHLIFFIILLFVERIHFGYAEPWRKVRAVWIILSRVMATIFWKAINVLLYDFDSIL